MPVYFDEQNDFGKTINDFDKITEVNWNACLKDNIGEKGVELNIFIHL